MKKYRLGTQEGEYELKTEYLGWRPEGGSEWFDFLFEITSSALKEKEVVIVSPDSKKTTLVMHQHITKDAFHLEIFGEERFKDWHHFAVVSLKENPSEKFIIPLH